jgi:hypothetical protein
MIGTLRTRRRTRQPSEPSYHCADGIGCQEVSALWVPLRCRCLALSSAGLSMTPVAGLTWIMLEASPLRIPVILNVQSGPS